MSFANRFTCHILVNKHFKALSDSAYAEKKRSNNIISNICLRQLHFRKLFLSFLFVFEVTVVYCTFHLAKTDPRKSCVFQEIRYSNDTKLYSIRASFKDKVV